MYSSPVTLIIHLETRRTDIVKDTLFIQFYGRTGSGWFDLCNGFSDTWDLCSGKGEFLWIPLELNPDLWYKEEAYQPIPLPIKKGTIHVSASYVNHLYQAYLWALAYPDIQVIVGGPVASERCTGKPGCSRYILRWKNRCQRIWS